MEESSDLGNKDRVTIPIGVVAGDQLAPPIPQNAVLSEHREWGRIESKSKFYGVIRCLTRDVYLPFLLRAPFLAAGVEPRDVHTNKDVEFFVLSDGDTNEAKMAVGVRPLRGPTLQFEEVLCGLYTGTIVKAPQAPDEASEQDPNCDTWQLERQHQPRGGVVLVEPAPIRDMPGELPSQTLEQATELRFDGCDVRFPRTRLQEGDQVELRLIAQTRKQGMLAATDLVLTKCAGMRHVAVATKVHKSDGTLRVTHSDDVKLDARKKLKFRLRHVLPGHRLRPGSVVTFTAQRVKNRVVPRRIRVLSLEEAMSLGPHASLVALSADDFTGTITQVVTDRVGELSRVLRVIHDSEHCSDTTESLGFVLDDVVGDTRLCLGDRVHFRVATFVPTGRKFAVEVRLHERAEDVSDNVSRVRAVGRVCKDGSIAVVPKESLGVRVTRTVRSDEATPLSPGAVVQFALLHDQFGSVFASRVRELTEESDAELRAHVATALPQEPPLTTQEALQLLTDRVEATVTSVVTPQFTYRGNQQPRDGEVRFDTGRAFLRNAVLRILVGPRTRFNKTSYRAGDKVELSLEWKQGEVVAYDIVTTAPVGERNVGVVRTVASTFAFASVLDGAMAGHSVYIASDSFLPGSGGLSDLREGDLCDFHLEPPQSSAREDRMNPRALRVRRLVDTASLEVLPSQVHTGVVESCGLSRRVRDKAELDEALARFRHDHKDMTPEMLSDTVGRVRCVKTDRVYYFAPGDTRTRNSTYAQGDIVSFNVAYSRQEAWQGAQRATQLARLVLHGVLGKHTDTDAQTTDIENTTEAKKTTAEAKKTGTKKAGAKKTRAQKSEAKTTDSTESRDGESESDSGTWHLDVTAGDFAGRRFVLSSDVSQRFRQRLQLKRRVRFEARENQVTRLL